MLKIKILPLLCALLPVLAAAQQPLSQNPNQNLIDQAYFTGRSYYVLRSGEAKMVVQADRAGLGPAFTFLLYEADKTKQTSRKHLAYNYTAEAGFSSSALEVLLKGFAFTALGTQLETRWVVEEGVPSVEALWWASGVKVREVISPWSGGVFRRRITLEAADLAGVDTVSFRLSLHAPATLDRGNVLVWNNEEAALALALPAEATTPASEGADGLTSCPFVLAPGERKTIDTYLTMAVPGSDPATLATRTAGVFNAAESLRQQTTERWKHSNALRTGDSLLVHLNDVCRYILPGYVSQTGRMDAGIFEYGGQWVRDASHTALGLIHTGEFEMARAMLEHMLRNMIGDEGTTMIYGNFEHPEREQLDQMGEFMHVMKSYLEWTGDASLLSTYKTKIVAMIERPLNPVFLDPATGMVHNRRELWERVFHDAFELAYQAWVISGLQDAADVATYLQAEDRAPRWREAAEKMRQSMLHHPSFSLVDGGHLVKRRDLTGEVVTLFPFNCRTAPGAPVAVEAWHNIMPDASMSVPISLGVVDPASALSRNTLDELEKLWNCRWSFGGYERYNSSAQIDQPGPWTFATTFIMRAQHEAGLMERSRRSLEWLMEWGGHSGAWHEEIPILRHQETFAGILPWTTAEVAYFLVHHMLGVKFENGRMVLTPKLYQESGPVEADLRYRGSRMTLRVDGSGPVEYAQVNGSRIKPDARGRIVLPDDFSGGTVEIVTRK